MPRIAVISFPGNNCEVESLRAIKKAGMEAILFRWNDDRSKLAGVDGYFLPGGFAYEDRGRSGMVAARDPIMDHIGQEAERGKVVVGNCNGAQVLVESGLIPLGKHLDMSLARNAVRDGNTWKYPGFLSQWIAMTPSCSRDRCAVSDWEGIMWAPIAHGEGRFTTRDPDLINELKKNDQIAFSYCDAEGKVSTDATVTPNGAMDAIAGICNMEGNVVAIMPHPERAHDEGDRYFASMKRWIEKRKGIAISASHDLTRTNDLSLDIPKRASRGTEIFIETIIVNNEERTVEQAAHRIVPSLQLRQWKYFQLPKDDASPVLRSIVFFNRHKERAYIRRGRKLSLWDAENSAEGDVPTSTINSIQKGIAFLRRDEPETEPAGKGSQSGVCYLCNNVEREQLMQRSVLEIFHNPHASVLEEMDFATV